MIDPTISAHYVGDCRKLLKQLPTGCVQTCITSPPYWGLRDYEEDGQIGIEDTPEEYVQVLVEIFDQVWRVLKDDGTLWLNLGDCYAGRRSGPQGESGQMASRRVSKHRGMMSRTKGIDPKNRRKGPGSNDAPNRRVLKPKDLVGIPWRVAFALQGVWPGITPQHPWYLRMDNIWSKPNPMPESVTDRTTKAHEYLFLLSKSGSYYYDADAIREPLAPKTLTTFGSRRRSKGNDALGKVAADNWTSDVPVRSPKLDENGEHAGANKRSVWTVASHPYEGPHFATYPPALIAPCVLACSRVGDLVLDPFFGSGTTGMVAENHERRWIGFDINPKYAKLAKERTAQRALPLAGRPR